MELAPAIERPRRLGVWVALAVWGALMTAVVTTYMLGHWATLPVPETSTLGPKLVRFAKLPSPRWLVVHVVYAECRCSQRVFDHLFDSQRPVGVTELILLVGEDPAIEKRARRAGLAIARVTPEQMKRELEIESAPMLVVVDPRGEVRYAGGYGNRKQDPNYRDVEIVTALVAGRPADALPLFGCGVSRELQQTLDPLGVKYR
jgi:hypothetical protein